MAEGKAGERDAAGQAVPAGEKAPAGSVVGRYRALFAVRGVKSVVAAMVAARMPTGCVSVLLVLLVSQGYGAAVAGMAAAAWTLGTAVFAPWLGRLVDRGCGPAALRACSAGEAAAVVLLLAAVALAAPAAGVVAAAFACGAVAPPVAGTTRSLWKMLVPPELLSVAYSFEILLVDVLYVSGPIVASLFVLLGAPGAGIAATSVCLVVGSVLLARSEPVRRYAQAGRGRMAEEEGEHEGASGEYAGETMATGGDGAGAEAASAEADGRLASGAPRKARGSGQAGLLRDPRVWLVLLACLGTMSFSGWLETLLPLYYDSLGSAALGGAAISVWSVGSILGVLAFVRMQPPTSSLGVSRQLALATGAYALVCAALVVTSGWGDAAVCATMFAVGCAVSPCTNLHYQLGGEVAPEHRQAEMFSWLNTATSAGISLGALLAGNVIEFVGYGAAFALPVLFVVASLACALALGVRERKAR